MRYYELQKNWTVTTDRYCGEAKNPTLRTSRAAMILVDLSSPGRGRSLRVPLINRGSAESCAPFAER